MKFNLWIVDYEGKEKRGECGCDVVRVCYMFAAYLNSHNVFDYLGLNVLGFPTEIGHIALQILGREECTQ